MISESDFFNLYEAGLSGAKKKSSDLKYRFM